jgi:HSF-type DNA-binding
MNTTVASKMGPVPPPSEHTAKPPVEPKAPYFHYRDHSHLVDPDPNKPVTIPGRIPTFPAKLFAILSRPDLADIISWMPHGRSWKVHKPREFEVKVIPSYFDHAKFSSFIRQANGWGFKRVTTKGTDRNSHYHELFLRGIPHLIKFMKRPVSGMNAVTQPKHGKGRDFDPDFYKISEDFPLPEFTPKMMNPLDESSFLNSSKNNQVIFGSTYGSLSECHSVPSVPASKATGMNESLSQNQGFFSEQGSCHRLRLDEAPSHPLHTQAFLAPRLVHYQCHGSTSQRAAPLEAPSSSCPIRQQEKDLDPLTILLNDLSEDCLCSDDHIFLSLINDPAVPPPSSLMGTIQEVSSHMVSPVEEKPLLHLSFEMVDPVAMKSIDDDDSVFEQRFTSELLASDFY